MNTVMPVMTIGVGHARPAPLHELTHEQQVAGMLVLIAIFVAMLAMIFEAR